MTNNPFTNQELVLIIKSKNFQRQEGNDVQTEGSEVTVLVANEGDTLNYTGKYRKN